MKKWLDTELKDAIKDYLAFLPKKEMELKYNRTMHNISQKMHTLKITRGYNLIKVNNNDVIKDYLEGLSLEKLANKYGVSLFIISRVLKNNKIYQRRITKKYNFDENYFSNIDSEEKAYFLGYLFADGNNNIKEKKVTLHLHKKDLVILDKFALLLKLQSPIKITNKGHIVLLINSPKISQDLYNLGCTNQKTFTLKFPDTLPNNLIHHFIRGYFDGDGCICYSDTKLHFNLVSTENFITEVQKLFINIIGLNKTKIVKNGKVYILRYSGNINCWKIMNYLYQDSNIFLERKFNIFKKYAHEKTNKL